MSQVCSVPTVGSEPDKKVLIQVTPAAVEPFIFAQERLYVNLEAVDGALGLDALEVSSPEALPPFDKSS